MVKHSHLQNSNIIFLNRQTQHINSDYKTRNLPGSPLKYMSQRFSILWLFSKQRVALCFFFSICSFRSHQLLRVNVLHRFHSCSS